MAGLVAKRYGAAIFELAKEKDAVVALENELLIVQESFTQVELNEFLGHPGVSLDEKVRVLEDSLSGKISHDLLGLLVLVVKKGRYSFIDKIFGGVGLRRGRSNEIELSAGDAVDFWRVLYANKKEGRLLLFAEMKLPGEAWLEFKVNKNKLIQTATFRPIGLLGRLYWFCVLPFHSYIFNGMLLNLTKEK